MTGPERVAYLNGLFNLVDRQQALGATETDPVIVAEINAEWDILLGDLRKTHEPKDEDHE